MKRNHIALPALQFAAAAFFATTALAETYCVDQNHKVVAASNCNGANNIFTEVDGPAGVAVGSVVPHRTRNVQESVRVAARDDGAEDDGDLEEGGFGYVEEREAEPKKPRPTNGS